MIDSVTLKRIDLLHPTLRDEVKEIYLNQIIPSLTGKVVCRISSTLRTFEEQNELYAKGRTKLYDKNGNRLGIVTKVKGGMSYHNYGLALDIMLIKDKNSDGKYETAIWETSVDFDNDGKSDWMEIVSIFKQNGWEWGGDWKNFKDRPHFQKTFGYTCSELLEKYNNEEFISDTKYVKL
jgi:peptidoglycan L-alanyl-D-glutamate endopeptidase CwlK